MKLGLENPRKLLHALGNPHQEFLKIQVAGTNGKGSTCAFLESICRTAGMRTGLYTSPHLISITERIKLNGLEISETEFAKGATKVRRISETGNLAATFFEHVTAIALTAFAQNKIELAILETGLGGRLDATTAANAEIVAITPIDYDHQQYLGESLAEIATEKAAIIRSKNQQVIVSKQRAEVEKIIVQRCQTFGLEPIRTDFDLPDVQLSLKGRHQIENAKIAIRLAEVLNIDRTQIISGLGTAIHKGRLEFDHGILFDGSHNIAGAKALRAYLEEFVSRPITLIFGAMKEKQLAEIAEILFPVADKLILTRAENSRSALVEDLAKFARQRVYLTRNVAQALEKGREFPDNLTCITGSLYLVGEAQRLMLKKSAK